MTWKTMATVVVGMLVAAGLWAGFRQGERVVARQDIPVLAAPRHAFYDGKPEYFVRHAGGNLTVAERRAARTLRDGSVLLDDAELTFYRVRRGDTVSGIRARLGRLREFDHFGEQLAKLDSFNIPPRYLRAGMWLPLPMVRGDREVRPDQFLAYAATAIREMRDAGSYARVTRNLLSRVSWEDLAVLVTATAMQEAGGQPLGRLELHRWEEGQRAFSFGYCHVVMVGPGLRARQRLGLTEGQTYHPVNSAKLFLAFLFEKAAETGRDPADFFPLEGKRAEAYAAFYNGTSWRSINPHYVAHVERNIAFARRELSKAVSRTVSPHLALADNR